MKNRFCLILSAIASLSIAHSTQAQIATDGTTATQVNGNAIAPTGNGTVNGGNLYHSFGEFNVPQSGVIFNTGNSAVNGADVRNIINRVTGENPSAVLGTIESRQAFPNANLYLMNPNGIIFGQNARLDIGGSFHATTGTGFGFDSGTFSVDKNSLSFPNGDPKTIRFAIAQPAGIINQGNLAVDAGKSITFTGGSIINTGTLTAPGGNVALTSVAGNSLVELRSPDAVLGLQVTNNAVPSDWNGKITELPKLAELLTGKVPEANQVVVKADGSLALVASPAATDIAVTNGMAIVSGKVDVSSPESKAGNVGVFGEKVGLVNAQIDASGALGGGTVLVGGSFQGNGIAPNAQRTFVSENSKIDVSARLNGDGGTAIVWSDLHTRFLGEIIAKGGDRSGDGGFVEVSGKQNLDYRGNVNTLAPNGKTGTLLLDPTDITIIDCGTFCVPITQFFSLSASNAILFSDPDTPAQPGNLLDVLLINGATSNVTLQATNDINFNTPVTMNIFGVGLTAQAGRDINFTDVISTNGGAINFSAGRNITGAVGTGNISATSLANAGTVNLNAGENITVNSIQAVSLSFGQGNDINVQAGGNIQTTGTTTVFGNTYSIVANASANGNAGNISLTSTNGAIDVSSGRVHAVATIGNSGNITFQAAGNIRTGVGAAPIAAVGAFIAFGGNGIPGTISFTSLGGSIDTSLGDVGAGNSNIGNGGNVFFQAAGNIVTSNVTAPTFDANGNGGNVSLISQFGSINTILGQLNATALGNGGSILLQALGNVTTSDLAAGSTVLGNAGSISVTSTGGAINTTLGNVRARIVPGGNGLGGTINFQASSDITTNEILATGTLGGGTINLTSNNGAINTVTGNIDASSTNGNGGNINFKALNSNITTTNLNTSGGSGGNVTIQAGGNISVNSFQAVAQTNGNGGNVIVKAGGNIQTTGTNIFGESIATYVGFPFSGNGGNISLTSTNGAIDVSSGRVASTTTVGNGGNITFKAFGDITTGSNSPFSAVSSFIAVGGNGTPGNISFTSTNGSINTSLGNVSAANANIGNGGNISFLAANNIVTAVVNSNGFAGNGGSISLQAGGNIITKDLLASDSSIGNAGSISLTSTGGAINTTLGSVRARISGGNGNGGIINFQSSGDINTNEILATGSLGGGTINLTSNNGAINTVIGNIDASSTNGNGGNINFKARNRINTTNLNTNSAFGIGGNISLDPIGDIVLNSANTSGSIQGGNFFAASTGGNIRVLGFVSSQFPACAGSSICSASNSGGTGGQIFLRHGGLNPFVIGNSSINGTAGIATTGSSSLTLGTIIPVGTSIFTQGNILVAPSGNTVFTPPKSRGDILVVNTDTQELLQIRDVMKREVDRFLKEDNLEKAFESIERAYISELGIFLGESPKPPTLNMNQAQDIVSDVSRRSGSPSVLIYPIMLNDRIEILVIPPKELGKPFHRYTNYANEEEITTVLNDYRASLRDAGSLDYLEQAQKLYNWVMRPIDAQLQALKIETVVFVMDSGLRVVPPAALHDGKQFLVERYASANIPSLRVTRLEERDRQNTRVLAMGLTEARGGFSALPTVGVEIRTISTQVLAGTKFLDQDFTVNNLQEQRGKAKYGILHLGTHGKFLEDRSKGSFIQFWDSRLLADKIPGLRFDQPVIDMLTLSACETAVGNNLGISGLAVESGARSILASLWAVSDVGTAPLMISFYKAFPDALSKATALRQAQLDLLKGKVKVENNQIVGVDGIAAIALPKGTGNVDVSHPFFWSSFILVGNWL